jgi:RNA polymerase sigma-70 factor (ECF subfamily)
MQAPSHQTLHGLRVGAVMREDDVRAEAPPTFEAVYREHRARIFSIVRSVVGADPDIDDVLQLVLIELHRSLPRFEARSKLTTWLYRLTVNVALQHLRRKKRARWLSFFGHGEDAAAVEPPAGPSETGRMEGRELLRFVDRAVAALSEKKRVVWQLYELEGFDPAEIGEVLGIPANTARSRLLSARQDIQAWFTAHGIPLPGDETR